jgi:hypothetical protein
LKEVLRARELSPMVDRMRGVSIEASVWIRGSECRREWEGEEEEGVGPGGAVADLLQ